MSFWCLGVKENNVSTKDDIFINFQFHIEKDNNKFNFRYFKNDNCIKFWKKKCLDAENILLKQKNHKKG